LFGKLVKLLEQQEIISIKILFITSIVVEDSSSVPNLTGPVKIEAENNAITFNYYTARNEVESYYSHLFKYGIYINTFSQF